MTRLLLDSSGYIAGTKKHPAIVPLIEGADVVAVNAVTVGELLAGFRKSRHRQANEKGLRVFLDAPRVECVPMTLQTAECYAVIVESLRNAGTPVATNDLWLAASAMEHGLRLVTTDSDFLRIPQIIVEHHAPEAGT